MKSKIQIPKSDITVNGLLCLYNRNGYKLVSRICDRSFKEPIFDKNNKLVNWKDITKEWKLNSSYMIYDSENDYDNSEESFETCLCGHNPINECCILHNETTNIDVLVGNCCVKKFFNFPEMEVVEDYKKAINDITVTLNKFSLKYGYHSGWIHFEDCQFYAEFIKPNGKFRGKKREKQFSKLPIEYQSYKRRINKSFVIGYNHYQKHLKNMLSVSTCQDMFENIRPYIVDWN